MADANAPRHANAPPDANVVPHANAPRDANVAQTAQKADIPPDQSFASNINVAQKADIPPDRRIEDRETSSTRQAFASRPEMRVTDLARSVIEVARRYAAAKGSSFASTHSLLVAILATGRSFPTDENAMAWWWGLLRPHHDGLEKAAGELYPDGLDAVRKLASGGAQAPEMTSDLAGVLDDAQRMAQALDSKAVGARHLVGALLKPLERDPTNATTTLERVGVDLPACRLAFFQELQRWNRGDPAELWWKFLGSTQSERPLSGYMSDLVAGDDLIGITREVEAMASLVAAWSVEPPLSIGLFGEWGSGKSFFMQKMKERVREIARQARKSEKGQREFGYYKNIVQVEFNAWHYVEGNLWASLVEHIFQNLKVLGDTDAEEADELKQAVLRQAKFFDEIGRQQVVETQAVEREAELRKEQADKEREAERLRQQQVDAENAARAARKEAEAKAEQKRQATSQDVVTAVYESPAVRDEIANFLRELGIGNQQLQTAADLRGAIDDALGYGATFREGWRLVVTDRRGWMLLALVLAAPVTVGAVVWGTAYVSGHAGGFIQWASGPISTLTGLGASAVTAWKRYKPKLQPLLDTVDKLKAKRKELDARVEAARQTRDTNVAALEAEAETQRQKASEKTLEAQKKGVEADQAAKAAQDARREMDDLRKKIDDLRPERRIATFIQERASAEDYRKFLGVPALVRRDFEKLSRMFKSQRAAEADGRDGLDAEGQPLRERNDPTVVNRIVLYVDDLDRCPPNRVVEVLRAIHLLLAFPLFVVVVAVDARWVRRSLLDRFALMLSHHVADPSNGAPRRGATSRARVPELPGEGATPDDYLEKIFQIAFWLRPLGIGTSKTLVQNLTRFDADQPPAAAPGGSVAKDPVLGPGGGTRPPGSPPGAGSPSGAPEARSATATHTAAPVGQRFEWTPVEARPQTLHVTASEREYMEQLALLIGRSPRAVKRFLNSYRLIKAMLQPWELPGFVGSGKSGVHDGLYHPTMLLLAAVTGAPELGQMICRSLRYYPGNDFEAWLRSVHGGFGGYREWATVHQGLKTLPDNQPTGTPENPKTMLDALKDAAERVDRFAFTPSRLPEREDAAAPAAGKKRSPRAPRTK